MCIEPDIEYPVPCEDDDDGSDVGAYPTPWLGGVLSLPEAMKSGQAQSAGRPAPDSPLGRLLNAPTRPGELVWVGAFAPRAQGADRGADDGNARRWTRHRRDAQRWSATGDAHAPEDIQSDRVFPRQGNDPA